MGANEHGVTIGNEAVFTREPYAAVGLTGMDLVRLGLERSTTAAGAVETIVALLEEFGQGGLCSLERKSFTYHNSFIVADGGGAFVLETAGRHHAVEEVRGARSISNGLTIGGFAERHSDFIKTRVCGCRARRARTQRLAEQARSSGDMMRILRDHGDERAWPHYSWLNGGLNVPCVHAGGLVASSQTAGSWVAELRPGGAQHWATGTAAPCTSLFKPVAVDEPLDESELGRQPEARADHESLWWRHERLHRAVMRDPERLGARYLAERDETERAWLADPPDSRTAFVESRRLEERWTEEVLACAAADTRPWFVRRYWNKRDRAVDMKFDLPSPAAV
jgi:dipeptidase